MTVTRPGYVVTCAKLHYETCKCGETIGPPRHDLEDSVKQFYIEGKYRPCLILGVGDKHYRIWCATAHPRENGLSYIPLKGVPGLNGESFLARNPEEIRWVHGKLLNELIGLQNKLENDHVMEELDQMMRRAPGRPDSRS